MANPPAAPGPIELNETISDAVNNSLTKGNPIVLAYVDEDGQPKMSFRGSAQVFSPNQLAVWVRNPGGGLQRALAKNPRISLLFRSPDPRMVLNFVGKGHLEGGDATRTKVYESSPQPEQNADKERKGLALVIDLDRVTGFGGGGMINMAR